MTSLSSERPTINILVVVNSMEKGGRTKRIAEETRGLGELGHRVRLVCFKQPPDWIRDMYPESTDWVVLPKRGGLLDLGLLRRLYREAREMHADVLHAHCEGSALYAGAVSRILRRKSLATVHRSEIDYYRRSWKHLAFFSLVDAFVAVSEQRSAQMRKGLGVGRRPLRVIHWGVGDVPVEHSRQSAREALGLHAQEVLLAVGHLGAVKGHDDSIRALRRIIGRYPGAHLYIAGDGSDADYSRLQALIDQLELAGSVTLLGQVRDVRPWLIACDLLLQPSREEAFGLVFIEAGLCRRPAVATRVGGIPEIIIDGETGLLAGVGADDEIAAALECLLANPDLARSMGEAAFHRVRTKFSLQDKVRELADFCASLMRGNAPGEASPRG